MRKKGGKENTVKKRTTSSVQSSSTAAASSSTDFAVRFGDLPILFLVTLLCLVTGGRSPLGELWFDAFCATKVLEASDFYQHSETNRKKEREIQQEDSQIIK